MNKQPVEFDQAINYVNKIKVRRQLLALGSSNSGSSSSGSSFVWSRNSSISFVSTSSCGARAKQQQAAAAVAMLETVKRAAAAACRIRQLGLAKAAKLSVLCQALCRQLLV
jgi:hypothetical protein